VLLGGRDYERHSSQRRGRRCRWSWANIDAIDDLVLDVSGRPHLVVSALVGNAGAGGAMMALAATRLRLRRRRAEPHYRHGRTPVDGPTRSSRRHTRRTAHRRQMAISALRQESASSTRSSATMPRVRASHSPGGAGATATACGQWSAGAPTPQPLAAYRAEARPHVGEFLRADPAYQAGSDSLKGAVRPATTSALAALRVQ
jgi:putative two-component system hydrogenase maturation factor HypX/HoxX